MNNLIVSSFDKTWQNLFSAKKIENKSVAITQDLIEAVGSYIEATYGISQVLDISIASDLSKFLSKKYGEDSVDHNFLTYKANHNASWLDVITHCANVSGSEYYGLIVCLNTLDTLPFDQVAIFLRLLKFVGSNFFIFSVSETLAVEDKTVPYIHQKSFEDWSEEFRDYFKIVHFVYLKDCGQRIYFLKKLDSKDNEIYFDLNKYIDLGKENLEFESRKSSVEGNQIQTNSVEQERQPLFTVLVPSFNQADYLISALDSIIEQSFCDWEAIVVNDGSTDHTAKIIQEYQLKDKRIKGFNKDNGGVATALNVALHHAKGQWVLWLSSDDLFLPNKMDIHLKSIQQHPEAQFFHTHYYFLDESTGKKTKAGHVEKILPDPQDQVIKFFEFNYINGISICIHRSLFEQVGDFDESLKFGQDVDMWLRLCAATSLIFINEPTCVTRLHLGQTTNSFPAAGIIDSSIALLKFLNSHSFPDLFPSLDLSQTSHVDHAVEKTLQVLGDAGSFINACGFSLALFDRFSMWLGERNNLSKHTLELMGSFANNSVRLSLPQRIKNTYAGLNEDFGKAKEYQKYPTELMKSYAQWMDQDGIRGSRIQPKHIFEYSSRFNECLSTDYALSPFPEVVVVSVILPTYNRPESLAIAVNSLIQQTHQDWDVIIVNDGGIAISDGGIFNDKRVRTVELAENCGQSQARNVALRLAKGEVICFLDDDDIFLPDHIQTIVDGLRNSHFVYTLAEYVIENDKKEVLRRETRYKGIQFTKQRLFVDNFIPINTWGIRRSYLKQIGFFDETMACLEDWDLLIRLSKGCDFVHIPRTTVEVHLRNSGKEGVSAKNLHKYYDFYNSIYKKHGDLDSQAVREAQELKLAGFSRSNSSLFSQRGREQINPYVIWKEKHAVVDADGQVLADRMQSWKTAPNFLILTVLESEDTSLLADTIDALNQQFYTQWSLAILSASLCPDSIFDELDRVHWIQVEGELYEAINQVLLGVDAFDWVTVIDPGTVLEAKTLSVCANYINLKPEWSFIYVDEDTINPQGEYADPLFKPDCNPDLLRSTPYVGEFCLVKKSVIDELGGYCGLAGVLHWDIALRVLDQLGQCAIGHVADILAHNVFKTSSEAEQAYLFAAGKRVLECHFKRNDIQAKVQQGLCSMTYFIDYPLEHSPWVSIIIAVLNNAHLAQLKHCISAILDNTHYEKYEIVISSSLSEQEIENVFEGIDSCNIGLSYCSYQGSDISPLSNHSLDHVKGEFLLFFNPDLIVLQHDWLDRLIAQGIRKNVGVVGTRIVDMEKKVHHAGIILGMGNLGVADYPHRSLPMDQPGYMNRALVAQNLSAVSSTCFLVKKDLFEQLMDQVPVKGSVFDHVEFCLQVNEQGLSVVWTPFVTLLLRQQHLIECAMEKLRDDADRILANWLPQIAHDPAYNRHLSLKHRHFQIETETDVRWNIDFRDRLRVYAFPANESGIGEYRVRAPLRALTDAAMVQSGLLPNHSETLIPDIVEIERAQPDVLLLQNGTTDYLTHAWQQYKKFNHVFRIYAQDDLVSALPQKHPLRKTWPKDIGKRLRKMLENSDRLIVATEPLLHEFGRRIADVRLVPNYLERSRWTDLSSNSKERKGKLRVGWAGGGQHHGDLELVFPVIEATKDEVDWVFMGMCPESMRPFIKEYHGGVSFDLYPEKLASLDLDLAIAPLEYNNFNMAKTNLRLLEYGILGWPVLCTNILPYQNAPVTHVPNNVAHWTRILREKINEPEALEKEGEALQQWVMENFLLEDHLDEWLLALTP